MELNILFMYVYSSFTTLVSSSKLRNRRNPKCVLGDHNLWPPVAARSKAYVYGRSPAEIVGSNPTGGMDVCLFWVLCVVR